MKVVYYPKVEETIRKLPELENSRILKVVDLFKDYKFTLTTVFLKKITKGIWELRAGKYRLLFGKAKDVVLITSIFAKKTQKMPKREIDRAIRRMKEYE